MTNSHVFQLDGIHQVVKRDVSIAATEAREQRAHEPGESDEGVPPECTEEQVEPDHIGLYAMESPEQAINTAGIVEPPATLHIEAFGLGVVLG